MVKYAINNKQYYKAETEFARTTGTILTEFDDEIATRQISIAGDKILISSSLTDWDEEIGYLLYDGKKSELDLTDSTLIDNNIFESFWKKGLESSKDKPALSYQTGNAAFPLKDATVIAHVVNNKGKWGKGFVLALSEMYPAAEKEYKNWASGRTEQAFLLGEVQFVSVAPGSRIFVANMLAQDGIRKSANDKTTYLSYEALDRCLTALKEFSLRERLSIQMPRIGAGLGGGDWEKIKSLLEENISYYKIECTILSLD